MPTSRLTQIGVSGPAYEAPVDVPLSTANWGWTAYPVGVTYTPAADSRLTQMGISGPAYPPASGGEHVELTSADWGWTAYNITVPGENFYLTTDNWGWAPQKPIICSQDQLSYAYSFNSNVWPSCVFNDHVFGPRTANELDLGRGDWGWQSHWMVVTFDDPINIPVSPDVQYWGWTALPIGVSYAYDVGLTIGSWGWQPFNLTVELPYAIGLQSADWGWTSLPVGVSYSFDTGLTIASYGWQTFPVTVVVPSTNVNLRKADWGWQSFPLTVRQASLLPGDIEAIAEAVYQKFLDEGVLSQIAWVFQRAAGDPTYPQTFHTKADGHNIEVGPHSIAQTTDEKGNVTQTRQS